MKGMARALQRVVSGSSSHSPGSSGSHHSADTPPTPTPTDLEEEYKEQPPPQAEDMDIDEEDALYRDFRDDWEIQAYAMLKNCEFQHTWHFDPDLLEKICVNFEFNIIWKTIG